MKVFLALRALRGVAHRFGIFALVALAIWSVATPPAQAQFRPIPNYVGIGAGGQFRNDINNHFSGSAPIAPRIVSLPLGQLPIEQDGQEYWCSDCKQASPCAGNGQGALAIGMQGQWNCLSGADGSALGAFPLVGNVSASSHKIQNLATATVSGDALSLGQSTLNALASPTAPYAMSNQPLTGLPAGSATGQALTYGQSSAQLTANQATAVYVSEGDNGNGSGTTNVIPAPANISTGNILVAVGNWQSASAVISFPSGFTPLRADSTTGLTAAWGCKVATGSEPSSYTLTSTVSAFNAGAIIQVKGSTCTLVAASVASANANTVTATGFSATPKNFVLSQGSFAGNTTVRPSFGQGIVVGRGGLGVAGFLNPSAAVPSATYSIVGGPTNFLVSQIALQAATTIQSVPLVMNESGARLGSLIASVNNVLNVMAPPYNAQGDGNTDDLGAIQSAVYDACGLPNPPTGTPLVSAIKSVYLPTPPSCYMHSAPIRIPCKGLEFYGTQTSGLCQNYYGHAIIQNSWGVANLPRGTSLVTGPGNSLPVAIDSPHVIDVGRFVNGTGGNNLAAHVAGGFNIALFVKHNASGGIVLQSSPSYPGSGNGAFNFTFGAGDAVTINVNTASGLVTVGTCGVQTQGTTYEIELDWDGTTYRAWQGTPGGTAISCGTAASASPMVQSPYEVIMLAPHGRAQFWPLAGDGGVDGSMVGNLDSIRFETGSLHTAAYTVPTTKFAADGNTYYLNNFENSLDGTQIGRTGTSGTVYSTVTGKNIGFTSFVNLHDLELCATSGASSQGPDGLWAAGGNDSNWRNLTCSNAYYSQIDLADNDYFARLENFHGAGGHYGALLGGAFNGSIALNNGYDSTDVACEVHQGGGGGAYENYHSKCVNRGSLRYGWIEDQSSANYFYPDLDMEVGDPNFVASVLLNGPSGYYFYGAGLAAASGSSFVQHDNGGAGSTFIGAHFGIASGTPNAIINYTNGSPATPTQLINTMNPAGVPLSNQAGNPFILTLGAGANANSLLQNLELQQVPKFNAGVAHLIVNAIADPAAATISVVGATASTAYGPYFVVCHDINGGVTLPSASSNTVANGPAALTSSNYINIVWSAVTGCANWDVLKGSTGTSLALGVTGTSYRDVGGSTGAYTAPARNSTGDISGLAQISTGTTFVKLPGTVVNGMRVYCSNCDPPANPPVTCTSAGARTGAFADGVNNQWLCTP